MPEINTMKGDLDKDVTPDIVLDDYNGVILTVKDIQEFQPEATIDEAAKQTDDSLLNFRIWKFSIFKPLLPLKIALFLWFGVGAVIQPFLAVYLKQRGMTLQELSLIYIITPVVQFLASVVSGIIADKLGRSKPVLVSNLILSMVFLVCMRLVPSMGPTNCENLPVNLRCHRLQFNRLIAETSCGIDKNPFQVRFCQVNCPENVTQTCDVQKNLICEVINREEDFKNFSLSVHVNSTYVSKGDCFYNVNSLTHSNSTYSWCDVPHKMYCSISCTLETQEKCSLHKTYRTRLYICLLVLMVLFNSVFSNTYRIMDVTAMCLVNDYNKDFGRERVWSIMGTVLWSPLAGYIISVTTKKGEPDNYDPAFYIPCILSLVCLGAIWRLKVLVNQPGQKMWKKSMTLLRKPDVIVFVLILFFLGATWGFNRLFMSLYLKGELNASSILISLLPAISSIYALPFLHTSKWWVNKIGTTNVFVLALLGASVSCLGYSFLTDPWWSIALDISHILTYHLLWVAVVVYSHSIAPEGLTATVISSAGGIHYGIGKGSGSMIGGLSMDKFGGPTAFRILSVMCFSVAVLYSVYLLIRRLSARKSHTFNDVGDKNKDAANPEDPKGIAILQNLPVN